MREEERRLLVRRLEREAFGIRLTLVGSAAVLVLLARVMMVMGLRWVALAAVVLSALYWVRLSRRLAAIRVSLRRGGLPIEAAAGAAEEALAPSRFLLILLAVLASVGVCLVAFVWLSGKLRP